ncbi:hypothetical protein [Streptomyces albireticuli]|uniref:Uncharacterized protein n=1 Tax=Streptomyces albireticuli TaxID=1940 RepID=A0A2A2D1W4_9ACTN|nr:hypothetical protein [Streptomyces albireticuli]MCD9195302.1 hypothetical protein [Streptomyces albireticuli]PAU45515.1 hypothetical protein CK936_28770 [Streptomyces albireticuli]
MNTDLLVPVRLRALVVNDRVRDRDTFLRWTPDYHLLGVHRSPEPSPYAGVDTGFPEDPRHHGVYLHWELPSALRRATTPGGEVTLPPAPNRWLVVRHAYSADGEYATAAWVVESDFLDKRAGTSPYLRPGRGHVTPTRIGRHTEASRWREPAADRPTFLTATGPGTLEFAAFQPHCQDVFSLHDPLVQLPRHFDRLGYQVIGWHAAAGDDPLADPGVREALGGSLGWQTDGTPPEGTRTVYTGRVHNVLPQYDPSGEVRPDPTVAVADSARSALTALTEHKAAADPSLALVPALFDQLQCDTLARADEPDNAHHLGEALHGAGFGTGSASYAWHAVPPGTTEEAPDPEDERRARAVEAALNAAQHAYDRADRELAGLRRRLYGMWRLQGLPVLPRGYHHRQLTQELDPARAGSLAARVRAERGTVDRLRSAVPDGDTPGQLTAAVDAYAREHDLPTGWSLKRVTLAPFQRALDPAVVLEGAGSLPVADDTALRCRFGAEAVTAVRYDGLDGELTADRPDLACNTLDLGADERTAMPGSTRALLREAFLLDPNSTVVDSRRTHGRPDRATATALRERAPRATPSAGTAPVFGDAPWHQPWHPLQLLWEVEYHPLPRTQWTFDGTRHTCPEPRPEAARTYTGRTLLHDHLSRNLADRLRQYAPDDPELGPRCEALADKVDGGDVLSTSLAGLRDMLVGQDPTQGVPPLGAPAELVELIGDAYRTSPVPGPLPVPFKGWQDSGFQQLRAGQFRFLRLTLVDSFGRSLDVFTPAGTGGASGFRHPVIAGELRPQHVPEALGTGAEHVVQLPPRLPQAARLSLDLLDASSRGDWATHSAEGDPIAGWIIPDLVDGSLTVHAPDGTALGLMRWTYRIGSAAREAVWTPLPGAAPGDLGALAAAFPHLHRLVTWLQGAGTNSPLPSVMDVLESSLVDILPSAGAASAALAGRPLALVRCDLRLDLDGPPVTDPGWRHIFDHDPPRPEFTDHHWPVRLGERLRVGDGLVGYFADGAADVLRTVVRPDDGSHPGIAAVGDGTHLTVTAGTSHRLTLLVDPHAPVHATTGLLPTATLEIPHRFTDGPLSRMRTVLRTGPLLTPATGTAPRAAAPLLPRGTVALPVRTVDEQTWMWAERARDGSWAHFTTSSASTAPRWDDKAPVLRSGLLTSHRPLPQSDATASE